MHIDAIRSARRLIPAVTALALTVGCNDRPKSDVSSAVDSSLARDLAMAQRQVAPEAVFNDAPAGGTTKASPVPAAPAPRPRPARAPAPRPTPSPQPRRSPAPVARAPREAPPAPVAEQPAAAPAAVGSFGVGSHVGMTINGRVCTLSALAGDKFTATVSSPTVGSNGAVIPEGATVVLEVTSVDRRDPVETSEIHFHVRAIDVNGESYPVDGEIATLSPMQTERVSSGSDKTKVVGGAVAGAVLGRIFGHSTKATVIGAAAGAAAGTAAARNAQQSGACLPEGSALRLTLSRELVVRREGRI